MSGKHAVGGETTAHEFSLIITNEDYPIHNSYPFVPIRGEKTICERTPQALNWLVRMNDDSIGESLKILREVFEYQCFMLTIDC